MIRADIYVTPSRPIGASACRRASKSGAARENGAHAAHRAAKDANLFFLGVLTPAARHKPAQQIAGSPRE